MNNLKIEKMKISYKWLKEYINIDIEPNKLAEILTNTGLEVASVEKYEAIKGGLAGLVIGEVKTCVKHSNADSLSVTTVNVGKERLLPIVCGAPNVAEGQKVVVATVGTTLYDDDGGSFKIKKSKIRGEVSEGMICAEDEIGIGGLHEGIMVLPADVQIGMPASKYFEAYEDTVIEIDITPNRADGVSHYGVARDIYAYLKTHSNENIEIKKPNINNFNIDNKNKNIDVVIENEEACPRYSGVTISGVTVKTSPKWLQNRLQAIGLSPINNVVDITNYVLFEMGHPLHAFDADKIKGDKVVVKTLDNETNFKTLDESEIKLSDKDLMICNTEEGMCIGGVFGGLDSGVTEATTSVFLECAYFNPVFIRKTAKRHAYNTDASYRFERGVDPNNTIWSLKRTANLIKKIAGGEISSDIKDVYPQKIEADKVTLRFSQVERLIGIKIEKEKIKTILQSLDIGIIEEQDDKLILKIPTYRVDVKREADLIEEILRIYGYNNIPIPTQVNSTLSYSPDVDENKLRNIISNLLTANGFNEAMSNSLTKAKYYKGMELYPENKTVRILNPLSIDLDAMRQTLLFGGLEAIIRNINYKNTDLKLYEYGFCYILNENKSEFKEKYAEKHKLALFITGNKNRVNWNSPEAKSDFYYLKSYSENILKTLNFDIKNIKVKEIENKIFSYGLEYVSQNKTLLNFGAVNQKILNKFDIEQEVYYANIEWTTILSSLPKFPQFKTISKFQEVKRDLALLIDENVSFKQIKDLAFKTDKKLIKDVSIFDVYKGKGIEEGKKSYAVNFVLLDEKKNLNEKAINKTMNKLMSNYKRQLNAQIR